MNCNNCGRQNPHGSLYCQDCGHRLGDWVPPERPGKMPTPPTGIARGREAAPMLGIPGAPPPGAAPMPPGPGFAPAAGAPGAAALAASPSACPRCGTVNPAHMRFCNNCGFALAAPVPIAVEAPRPPAAGFAPPAPVHLAGPPAPGPAPRAPVPPTPVAGQIVGPAMIGAAPPAARVVCWRCRGNGDPGAEFCKFCGARYADDPMAAHAQPASAAPAPSNGAPPGAPPPHAPSARAPAMTYLEAPRAEPSARAILVAILKDGSDGRVFPLQDEQTDLGRSEGQLVLAEDPYLSARHARLVTRGPDQLVIRDLDSINGVYVRLREPVDLHDGDMILLGQQVMRFDVLQETELSLGPANHRGVLVFGTPDAPRLARLTQYTTEGVGRDVHYLYRDETVIGREQGDIVCTDDPFMSRRHAAVTIDRAHRRFVLRDLGSSNGTSIRIRGERALRPGDQFRVGRHLFRYDRGHASGSDRGPGDRAAGERA